MASCRFFRRREPPDQSVMMYASKRGMSLTSSQQPPPLREEDGVFSTGRLYRELKFLGRTKGNFFAGFDFDCFAGRRIPAHSR